MVSFALDTLGGLALFLGASSMKLVIGSVTIQLICLMINFVGKKC